MAETQLKTLVNEHPVIDMGALFDDATRADELDKLRHACRDIGYFFLVNHGVSEGLLNHTFAQSKAFFDLPLDKKLALKCTEATMWRGYEDLRKGKTEHYKEGYLMGRDMPPSDKPYHGTNPWPAEADVPNWKADMCDYYETVLAASQKLARALSASLGMDESVLDENPGDPMSCLRLLKYPPNKDGESRAGIHEHTDWGFLSLIFQQSGGLAVKRVDGEWVKLPKIEGACVVNLGDMAQMISNDTYAATPHLMVNQTPDYRYSIAFFYDLHYDMTVKPAPNCVTDDNPAHYKPITVAEYVALKHEEDFDAKHSH